MGLFFEKRAVTTQTTSTIDFLNGLATGNNGVYGTEALENSDVFTAINIISGDIASSKFKYKPEGKQNDRVLELLNTRPNAETNHYTFFYAMMAQMLLYGNSYARIVKGDNGVVNALQFIHPEAMAVIRNVVTGRLRYEYTDNQGKAWSLSNDEVLHFKAFSMDTVLGRSPLESLQTEISMLDSGNKLLSGFFNKGVQAGGILKLNKGSLNNDAKKEIKKAFEAVNAGQANANSVIILDESQEFEQYNINTDILKMIQSNQYSTKQIAKVYGIPLNRFGQELVNSGDDGANSIYIASTISSHEQMLCDEIEHKLGLSLELDISPLINDTQDDRRKSLFSGDSEGIEALTENEIRAYYGLEAIDGGDKLYMKGGKDSGQQEGNQESSNGSN